MPRNAEDSLQRFLALSIGRAGVPQDDLIVARKWLCFLLSAELRLDDRRRILATAHQDWQINVNDSKQYFFPRLLIWRSSTGRTRFNDFLEQDSADLLLNVALARYLTAEGKLSESRKQLESVLTEFPNHSACRAAFLECCFEQNDWAAISETFQTIPPHHDLEPHLTTPHQR